MADYLNSITALARAQYEHSVHELMGRDRVGFHGSVCRLNPSS